ncbi:divergent polysaccharide deacetylase family protein [Limimaricola pyoseonensis]|uniref:Uncharacterized conserved protein YibQ, putative polysaccharide deacetylase 2 family n=1 Tax=Limimaricola pyoseonensis TaxID=521013 RepID=A0A1G7GWJ6_9RHOB|nr:divergent polysaccharide deacetylase family protein [Limimaricola pyoseonensis]SDE92536.1 Uncharacterized conserved protein YibQ, putative polysaccharide deacetylase 2 family [Limimaricola pyoseonensis]
MGAGFIIGGIWGLLVSAGALAVASLIAEPPSRDVAGAGAGAGAEVLETVEPDVAPAPDAPEDATDTETDPATDTAPDLPETAPDAAAEVEAPGGSPFEAPDAPRLPETEPARVAATDTPRADVPAGPAAIPEAETAPAATPEASPDAAGPGPVPQVDEGPQVALSAETPVLPSPQSRVIEVPASEADITVSTETPPPPSQAPREVIVAESDETNETGAAAGIEVEVEPVEETAEAPEAPEAGAPAGPDDAPASDRAAGPGEGQGETGSITVLPDAPQPPAPPAAAEAPGVPEAPDGSGRVIMPTGEAERDLAALGLPGGETGVRVRRPGADAAAPEAGAADETALPDDAPALLRYAAPHDAPAGAPLFSVTLIDDGALDAAVPAAASIPFPVTIAIDPELPDAAERMAAWRAAGYEVAALSRLPRGATPADVEVAFGAAFAQLPETVALVDAGDGGLSADAGVTRQALDRLAADGRGLAALAQGLATPLRRADEAGVPAVEIYRDLDAAGQDARVIRRFLDQAAFRARQQGAVALLARLRPETVTALTLWGSQNRAGQVAQVPLSAVLQMQTLGPGK